MKKQRAGLILGKLIGRWMGGSDKQTGILMDGNLSRPSQQHRPSRHEVLGIIRSSMTVPLTHTPDRQMTGQWNCHYCSSGGLQFLGPRCRFCWCVWQILKYVFSDMVLTPMDSNSLNSFWWIYKAAYFIHLRIKLFISLCHMGDVRQMLMFTCLPIVQSFPASSKWSKILVIKWKLLEKSIV